MDRLSGVACCASSVCGVAVDGAALITGAGVRLGAAMVGKPELAQRLCGSLQIDLSETREVLAWEPVVSVEEGLRSATKGYVS